MSEQTVAEKLAAATCEAAQWGWSDETGGGNEILCFLSDSDGYAGIVNDPDECEYRVAINWRNDGKAVEISSGRPMGMEWDLVPLPAPPPETQERLTDEQLDAECNADAFRLTTRLMALECRDSRKEIAELKAGIERFRARIRDVENDRAEVARERDAAIELAYCRAAGPGVKAITWKDIARIEKGRGDNLQRKLEEADKMGDEAIALGEQHRMERDEAIELARRMRDSQDRFEDHRLRNEFDAKYSTNRHVPETDFGKSKCSHEVAPDGTCHRCGTVTREFPFDRPGWFYRGDINDNVSFTIGTHAINDYVEKIGTGWWIHVGELRTGVRSASPAGPWEPCPKGGES